MLPLFLEGLSAMLSGQWAGVTSQVQTPGSSGRRWGSESLGFDSRGPSKEPWDGEKDAAAKERLQCAESAGARAAPAGAPSLARTRRGRREPRTTPMGSRGAITSRRVCPGALRAGEEPRGLAPWPRRAPGRLSPHCPAPPRRHSPASPAPAHSVGL